MKKLIFCPSKQLFLEMSKEETDRLRVEIFEGIIKEEHPKEKKLTGIYKERKTNG